MDRREELAAAGRWLRTQRERRNLSVRDLAIAVGASTQAVYNWETGKNAVSDESAQRLADLFGRGILEVRRNLGLWVPDEHTPGQTHDQRLERAQEDLDELGELLERARAKLDELRSQSRAEGEE